MTGLAFWSPYLYWLAAIVGGGPAARFWHPWLGLIFSASLFWTFKEWRGDMKIDDTDRAWAKAIPDYIKNEDDKLPPVGRFNYGQKLFFWGIFYSVILLLLSGVALWYTEALPWSLRFVRYAAVLIHASVALITIGLFLIHVYMSAVLEEGSFGSMIQRMRHTRLGLDVSPHLVLRRHRQIPTPAIAARNNDTDAKWDRRIRRATELTSTYPFAAEGLRYYARLATFQKSLYAEIEQGSGGFAAAFPRIVLCGMNWIFSFSFQSFPDSCR